MMAPGNQQKAAACVNYQAYTLTSCYTVLHHDQWWGSYRKKMLGFMHKAARVTDDIMSCFAIGLGLPEDYFKEVSEPM